MADQSLRSEVPWQLSRKAGEVVWVGVVRGAYWLNSGWWVEVRLTAMEEVLLVGEVVIHVTGGWSLVAEVWSLEVEVWSLVEEVWSLVVEVWIPEEGGLNQVMVDLNLEEGDLNQVMGALSLEVVALSLEVVALTLVAVD